MYRAACPGIVCRVARQIMRRNGRLSIAAFCVAAEIVGGGIWWSVSGAPHTAQSLPLMPLTFTHQDHGAFNCVVCHHNYTEPKLASWPFQHCIECHKKTPELALIIERQFHQQCEGCHLKLKREKRASGPVRACHVCHAEERPPRF
ncbi:cytochrome c3 family protein [Acetobacter aceti]|uniref:cytochrome c3 family protein n=2 Tax=Acetobacter aceti TaxID=435 RepID=UPI0009D9BE1A